MKDPKPSFRRFQARDRKAVWELHILALRDAGVLLENGPRDDDLDNIETVYREDGGEFLVGELDGRIIAMGALRKRGPGVAEIKRIRVHPDFQRRGFGQAMLLLLETRAREQGYRRLLLDTAAVLRTAQHLYRKNGYRETGRRNVGPLDVIDYENNLEE